MNKNALILITLLLTGAGSISAQSFIDKATKAIDKAAKSVTRELDKAISTDTINSTIKQGAKDVSKAFDEITNPTKMQNVPKLLKGKVYEVVETNVWHEKTTTNTYVFNQKKQLLSLSISSPDGTVRVKAEYEYNADGLVSKLSFSKEGGAQATTQTYQNMVINPSFDEEPAFANVLFFTKATSVNKGVISYSYNADGSLNDMILSGTGNGFSSRITDKDRVVSDAQRDAKDRLRSATIDGVQYLFAYDANGYLLSCEETGKSAVATTTYSNYAYDLHRNWIKRTVRKVGQAYGTKGFTMTTTRAIVYY